MVTSERLRFDFNLHRGLKDAELAKVEELVNGWVAEDTVLTTREMPLAEAKAAGTKFGDGPLILWQPIFQLECSLVLSHPNCSRLQGSQASAIQSQPYRVEREFSHAMSSHPWVWPDLVMQTHLSQV